MLLRRLRHGGPEDVRALSGVRARGGKEASREAGRTRDRNPKTTTPRQIHYYM